MTDTIPDRRPAGLTRSEVADRVARGLVNDVPTSPSRTVGEIVRANVLTRFNLLLGALVVVILLVAPIQDALFGLVLVANTAIGVVQELRAKRALDHLALLSAPRARVVRDHETSEIPVDEVVLDDLLELAAGDQIVVDGRVVDGRALEVDESLLTGESEPVIKHPGDDVLSGSFVVAGTGRYQATRVGKEGYAVRLAEEARKFTLVRSELRSGVDWILGMVGWLLVPTIGLLIWSQLSAHESIKEAIRSAVAGTVGMVPQGLVLLTSVAFAVGVIRLGRRNVLVQELPAVEGLARVDVVCFDKTGTLTEGRLMVHGVQHLDESVDTLGPLGALGAADPTPNATLRAIAAAFPPPAGWTVEALTPFSSERKWSGAAFAGRGSWLLGAPEVLFPQETEVIERAERLAAGGYRVLVLGRSPSLLQGETPPEDLQAVAMVVLGDRVRDDATKTLEFFERQGVAAKVISGDHPHTVAAIARRVGVRHADRLVDARTLPDDDEEFADVVERGTVFGRVTPHQKRRMVSALRQRGHVVAMTGDGVNDVLALKDADIGIAMGSGSSASRAVAEVVLIDGDFDNLPIVVAEGRRVIANIERVANLFVTKTIYAMLLALVVGIAGVAFPFLPRHLTVIGSLTIGIPGFFLALEPTARRARTGFVKRVLEFALPTGTLAATATYLAYRLALYEGVSLEQARTVATLVLCSIGFFVLVIISRPLNPARRLLVAGMVAMLLLVTIVPSGRDFYAIYMPGPVLLLASGGVIALTGAVLYFGLRTLAWVRNVPQVQAVTSAVGKTRKAVVDVAGPLAHSMRAAGTTVFRAVRSLFVRARRWARERAREGWARRRQASQLAGERRRGRR